MAEVSANAAPDARPAHEVSDVEAKLTAKKSKGEWVSQNINQVHEEQMTFGQRLADKLAVVAGSWSFILGFLGILLVWVIVNGVVLLNRSFDPYPFILLNLVLSGMAGVQAPVIMMSQNRQEAKDRLRAEHDYEVNLKAEMEIEQLHRKMDNLRERQWKELVEMQQTQIKLLEQQLAMLQQVADKK